VVVRRNVQAVTKEADFGRQKRLYGIIKPKARTNARAGLTASGRWVLSMHVSRTRLHLSSSS
jgi:hypothetical protein